jgi:phage terminase small subunit
MPSYLLENRGAFKKNPNRTRTDAVDGREIGSAPAHLDSQHAAAWAEIVDNAIPGTLGQSDRIAVELMARLLVKLRDGMAAAGEIALLANLQARFGCTPADRSRVVARPQPKKNDFDDL